MGYNPNGTITRRHFLGYKAGCAGAPPPLHVVSAHKPANHYPLPRPIEAGGHVGPVLVLGGAAEPSLGIDPTDSTTWEGRGYRQSTGMIGRFNRQDDWQEIGYPMPAGSGVRPR